MTKFLKTTLFLLVKTAYYKLARKYHPDRVLSTEKKVANEKFTIIHQAYSILSNAETKSRYDNGDSNVIFGKMSRTACWELHMKIATDENVNEATGSYKNSAKEKEDIAREIVIGNGSMAHLMNNIPFMRVEDQPRILLIIQELMETKRIPNIIKIKKINPQ